MVDGLKIDMVCPIPGKNSLTVQLDIQKGELIGVYGDSGIGKTTFLRVLAGFLRPESGRITMNQQPWFDADQQIYLNPGKRKVSMVFQENALYPHMSISNNIRFANQNLNTEELQSLLEQTGLSSFQHKRPDELSGGQLQRAALARAFAQEADVLLLDEPLSSLDKTARSELRSLIRRLHKEKGLITILVSHDIEELQIVSNRVFRLKENNLSEVKINKDKVEILGFEEKEDQLTVTVKWKGKELTFDKKKNNSG